ncbi:MAG: hypothetical protein ACEPOZ_17645 [Marinifilaceae bacterium]
MTNNFFIGYNPQLPKELYKFVRRIILWLFALFLLAGILIAFHHREISTSSFEFGQLTTVEGVYFATPVPLIKVLNGKDYYGNPVFKTIPLVNYAKFGAEELMQEVEKEYPSPFHGKKLQVMGTLLYDDGKILLELTKQKESILSMETITEEEALLYQPHIEDLGTQSLLGEIVDSKCYFGAMRPGFGKPHRSCAVRCISGGIPPVLAATNYMGETNYFLIRGHRKQAINKKVLPFVAEPVRLTGRLVRFDDWMVIYVDPQTGIARQ